MNAISENIIDSMERRFPTATPNPNAPTPLSKTSVGPNLDQNQGAQSFVVKATELAISVEGSAQRIVVKILDSETKEVIKQIPDEDVLAVAEDLHRRGLGLLNQTA